MLTLRGSAALLGAANSIDGLVRIARAAGFCGAATSLDPDLRTALAIPTEAVDASIVAGDGPLRALVFTVKKGTSMRGTFARIAARFATRTPQALWILLAAEMDGDVVAIGAPDGGTKPVRVAALMLNRTRIMDSDAETVRSLAAVHHTDDLATYARFVEILGRDAISRRFFRTLEQCVNGLARSANSGSEMLRAEIALLYSSRLLFLGFLEAKGWLNDDPAFLMRLFDDCMAAGGGFHDRVMRVLFFGTLNTPVSRRARRARLFGRVPFLNGGLFTPTVAEKLCRGMRFDDEAIGRFLGELFGRYRFTAREETASFEEAAIDPEMLGRAFECLMAAPTRRASGVFYTPHDLVGRVTISGLEDSLAMHLGGDVTRRLLRGESLDSSSSRVAIAALTDMRVLDPACGSGAFLVHTLDRIATLFQQCGDLRPVESIRRQVLARSIFGVDVSPTAVWLCQLRLWLSIVIDTHERAESVPPLPNLDRNVRVGDSLSGEAFGDSRVSGGRLRGLRERYARATGRRKASLARALDREERRLLIETTETELATVTASRRDLVAARRGRDLFGGRYVAGRDELRQAAILRDRSVALRRRLREARRGAALPFSFPAHFADVAAIGGFTLIVGNPPWVRPHRLDVRTRETLRRQFVVARSAQWASGAEAAGAGRGFASQVDLAALFVERSLQLLAPGAALSLLLPAKLWRSLAGGGVRRLVTHAARLSRVEDYSDVPSTFDAAVYPGLLVATRPVVRNDEQPDAAPCTRVLVVHRAKVATAWKTTPHKLAWDDSVGAPWVLLPPDVRRAFDDVRDAGVPLAQSRFGRPLLGVKCGLNDAFVVTSIDSGEGVSRIVSANGREGLIEADCLRPVARGEGVTAWGVPSDRQALIWPHDAHGAVLDTLPPGLARWLAPYRRALLARSDARSAPRWWSLFRTEAARSDAPRVIWADIGKIPRAAVLDAGDPVVPLNSCYVARCRGIDDALALSALLNSALTAAWLSAVAEPARGGYHRYLGWTMSLLPIPGNWEGCRDRLANLARRARDDRTSVAPSELLDVTIDAYGLMTRDVEPLLAWAAP